MRNYYRRTGQTEGLLRVKFVRRTALLLIWVLAAFSSMLLASCRAEVTPAAKPSSAEPVSRVVSPKKAVTLPAGVEILEDYTRNNLFETGDVYWVWKVVIVPKGLSRSQLIDFSRQLFAAYPEKRMRIFDDKAQVAQWVQRDVYLNDKSGKAREVAFPEDWAREHHLGNIHERSDSAVGRWQVVSRFGEHIAFLE